MTDVLCLGDEEFIENENVGFLTTFNRHLPVQKVCKHRSKIARSESLENENVGFPLPHYLYETFACAKKCVSTDQK